MKCVGADPFVENARGSTPWDISLINGHTCSIEFANFAMFEGLCYVKVDDYLLLLCEVDL